MRKSVLVTGASSGIGLNIAQHLATRGHLVYATARNPNDLKFLGTLDNIIPISLDVTNEEQIRDMITFIKSQGNGLYGLVNNAGLGGMGSLNTWSERELKQIFNVNVFSPWRITNACMDMLLSAKGRIVNIGSQGGFITSKYFGPYTMKKQALETYTEALRQEFSDYQIKVSLVQPANIHTNMEENSISDSLARFHKAQFPFNDESQQVLSQLENSQIQNKDTKRDYSSPDIVSTATYHALFNRYKTRRRSTY
jgi:short-subunit dehydrogenase